MAESISIHPTALVHPAAVIEDGVRIGAFSIVEADVHLGRNVEVQDHVVIRSFTRIGEGSRIFPFAVLGAEPQHLKYKGEPTIVEIGKRVTIRESVTIHRGTVFGRGATTVGDDCFLMAYTHIAHDCMIGQGVTMANCVQMAGHCEVHDYATIGGMSAVPQFFRIGRYAFVGGGSILRKEVPPFLVGKGNEFRVQGINQVGLTRRGFSGPTLQRLKALYRIFFMQNNTVGIAIERAVAELGDSDEIRLFLDFVRSSKIGIARA